jgi:hypothetical protein
MLDRSTVSGQKQDKSLNETRTSRVLPYTTIPSHLSVLTISRPATRMRSLATHIWTLLWAVFAGLQFAGSSLAFVPIYGGPEYNSSTHVGYQIVNSVPIQVNNVGASVGTFSKFTGSIQRASELPLTWSTSGPGPTELTGPASYDASSTIQKWAYAINDSNIIVGAAYNDALGERPIRWDATGAGVELANLGTRGPSSFTWGQALAINNAGTVAGYSERWIDLSNYDHAARWNAGGIAITELGELPHDPAIPFYARSRALAVNESNTAVGYAQKLGAGGVDLGERPVRWDGSGTVATELGNLGTTANGVAFGHAVDVNESGAAVGYSYTNGVGSPQAVRWNAGTAAVTELDDSGSSYSQALAINDFSVAVGYVRAGSFNRAVRWDTSSTVAIVLGDLGQPGDSQSFDINNQNIAVGIAPKTTGGVSQGSRAVAWRPNGVAVDLNQLIDPASGWVLTSAASISETKWISGTGQYDPDGQGGRAAYTRYFTLQLPGELPGDYNADYVVDAADYIYWRAHVGQTLKLVGEDPNAGTPGVVDDEDYSYWRAHVGTSLNSGFGAESTSSVPEPAYLSLMLFVAVAILRLRRKELTTKRLC